MKNLFFIIICSFVFYSCPPPLVETDVYLKKTWKSKNGETLPYRILYPDGFKPHQHDEYPVLLFLHGAGERGKDNQSQLINIAPKFLKNEFKEKHKAIVIFPQCPKQEYWANVEKRWSKINSSSPPTPPMQKVMELIDDLLTKQYVNKDQIYVAGLSMGGFGTFDLLSRKPDVFAAAIAICGGADLDQVQAYKNIPIQIFHGAKDPVVPVKLSKEVHEALKAIGGNSIYTEYPDGDHLVWDQAFDNPDLVSWLFSQRKSN